MLIAKVQNDQVLDVADYKSMFPDTSFGTNGPDAQFLADNGCLGVTVWKPYDHATEKLVACPAYVEDNQVFTIMVEPKTQEDLDADIAAAEAAQKAARAEAYRTESDPLFFKAQRGEATMEEWLAKVEEIKNRGQFVDLGSSITGAA
jgi:hypothetical protein